MFEKILNSSADIVDEDNMQATVWALGQHRPDEEDWSLMKKHVKRVMEVGWCLLSGRPLSKFGLPLENSESVL
jgi:hypothetical protein